MTFPYDNWQFWVVTVAALAGLALVLRPLWPTKKTNGEAPTCNNCPSSGESSLFKSKREKADQTTLTVLGKDRR